MWAGCRVNAARKRERGEPAPLSISTDYTHNRELNISIAAPVGPALKSISTLKNVLRRFRVMSAREAPVLIASQKLALQLSAAASEHL